MRYYILPAAGMLALALTADACLALDRVQRNSASTAAQGEILEVSKKGVTIKPPGRDPEEIPANDILNIRWNDEPPRLNLFRSNEADGRLQMALDGYRVILEDVPADRRNLKADVEFLIARTLAKMGLEDPTKRDEAIEQLEAFRKAHADFYRYYESLDYLGRLYLVGDRVAEANAVYQLLGEAPWPEYETVGLLAKAELHLSKGEVREALEAFNSVVEARGDTPASEARRYQAILGKARCLQRLGRFDEAAEVVQEMIEEVPAENTRLQAQAYLRLGDARQAEGKQKEALLAYLHVDVLFQKEEPLHAESLYQLARLWASVGHADRAADASARLKQEYPDTEWAQKVSAN